MGDLLRSLIPERMTMEKNTAPVLVRTTWASLGHRWPKEAIKAQVAERRWDCSLLLKSQTWFESTTQSTNERRWYPCLVAIRTSILTTSARNRGGRIRWNTQGFTYECSYYSTP